MLTLLVINANNIWVIPWWLVLLWKVTGAADLIQDNIYICVCHMKNNSMIIGLSNDFAYEVRLNPDYVLLNRVCPIILRYKTFNSKRKPIKGGN